MDPFDSKFNFNLLSIKDLVEARELFHLHLIRKRNVVATAIGRYRIRKTDPWPNEDDYKEKLKARKKEEKTIENTEVRDYSWPCILVFVNEWEGDEALCASDDLVPKNIYMPDGRVIPVCVVKAPKSRESDISTFESKIFFPKNYVGGGFPLITHVQCAERVASIGCIVTDGNKYYALTNKHVTGEKGTPIYTKMKGKLVQIGSSTGKEIGKCDLRYFRNDEKEKTIVVNQDVGLIEIDDVTKWKTDILGIGAMGELLDLNKHNLSLTLITSLQVDRKTLFPNVKAFGSVSGLIEGEIIGLFYRYKSLGGIEYVSDFVIGASDNKILNIHHGDSGTIWFIETNQGYCPFAIHWGQHNILCNQKDHYYPLGLASNLTNVCVDLDVDVVRDWNLDNDFSWGKTGHFKIAAKACELVSNNKLSSLLNANKKNIGYTDSELIKNDVVSGAYISAKDDFVPLADVADIIWRSTRPSDGGNHYCDVDEKLPDDKPLLDLSLKGDEYFTIDFWLDSYDKLDKLNPNFDKKGKFRPRDGALPFRVWQMYQIMVRVLKNRELDKFICAGGTMSHYVADACNSLHISYLNHGRNESEDGVHSYYENNVIDKHKAELFELVNEKTNILNGTKLIHGGKEAGIEILKLMKNTIDTLSPEDICDLYADGSGDRNRINIMWEALKDRTSESIARGCVVMAKLWQSAWVEGDGDGLFKDEDMVEISRDDLKELYNDKTFVPSYKINNPKLKEALEQ